MKVSGDIKDRGRIKWTAMMLPEHLAELRDWHAKDELDPKPEVDEDDMQLLQEELEIAFMKRTDAVITTWRAGKKETYIGKIVQLDPAQQSISVEGPFGKRNIMVGEIFKVRSM
ncbi:YolD-like family protein [Sporosarcina sp. Marseille-Q4943]|uniref:YolD-like family protein n=1 Tax=Sporosarcina sp. Marseille-Q4943 TaxID=2942204 RepID=UPI00208DA779|nr:YolD-like family protein [Sporosarcina sp. Marseille-Q4943]